MDPEVGLIAVVSCLNLEGNLQGKTLEVTGRL